jgi:WD40 repeat protein
MDAGRLTSWARRAAAPPPLLFGRWLRRRAISALLADGSGAGMNAVIEALPSWSGAERDWLLKEIVARASPHQRDAACAAWAKSRDAAVGRIIAQCMWVASAPPELTVLTALCGGQFERLRILGRDVVSALLEATADRDPELAQRARKVLTGADGVSALLKARTDPDPELAQRVSEVLAAVERLEDREIVCTHFFRHADPDLGALLVAWAYVPKEAARQALLFFLTGQWQHYEDLDVDHSLLRAAYEAADPALRRRITDQAVRHGRQEWLRIAAGLSGERLGQMSTAEWEAVLQVLSGTQNHAELWRLAQEAPPRWSKRLLDVLGEWPLGQVPDAERASLSHLLQTSAACGKDVPKVGALTVCRWHKALGFENLMLSTDSRILVISTSYNIVYVWRLQDGELLAEFRGAHKSVANCSPLAMTPDGLMLAYNDKSNGLIRVWRATDGELIATVNEERAWVHCLAISPDGSVLVGAGNSFFRFWRLPEGDLLATPHSGEVSLLAIDPGGTVLASAGASVSLWNLRDGTPLRTLIGRTDYNRVYQMQFSPDGMLLAAGYANNICLWRVSNGELLADLRHTARIERFEISSDGELLVSVDTDGVIHIWRLPDGKLLTKLKADESRFVKFAIAPDVKVLFTATSTQRGWETGHLVSHGIVKLWSLPDGAPLGILTNLEHGADKLIVSSDGRLLVSYHSPSSLVRHPSHASEPIGVYVWALPLQDLSARPIQQLDADQRRWLFTQLQNPQLTPDERNWLDFIAALIRWRGRYDISLAAAPSEGPGEFDIQLGT